MLTLCHLEDLIKIHPLDSITDAFEIVDLEKLTNIIKTFIIFIKHFLK